MGESGDNMMNEGVVDLAALSFLVKCYKDVV